MIVKKLYYEMVFGQKLEGFAMSPDAIDYYPDCIPPDHTGQAVTDAPPPQKFELTLLEEPGKGILRSEHGLQKLDDVVESEFSISFTAYAGSGGDELFRYVLMLSDSTDQIVGFNCGIKPFFRSFMPLRGRILEK